jgi:hypothetical protein
MELLFSTMKLAPDTEFGHIDFSYGVVAKNFQRSLEHAGMTMTFVPRPEFMPSQDNKKVHLMMRKFRAFRPIIGAYNIAVISWEFNALQDGSTPYEGLHFDQVGMLNMADQIWVASSHLKEVFESYDLQNVHFIPCPIGKPFLDKNVNGKMDRSQRALGELSFVNSIPFSTKELTPESIVPLLYAIPNQSDAKIYVTIFNPHDHRKNIEKLILSFYSFALQNSNAYLIIKCNTELKLLTSVLKLIANKISTVRDIFCKNILILNERFSEEALAKLYEFADFYFCLSHGEGQNLPLQESMAKGCVPVSVSNTAMSDCVNNDTAFEIKSHELAINIPGKVCFHNIPNLTWYDVTINDVLSVLEASLGATEQTIQSKIDKCLEVIEKKYSDVAVANLVQQNLSLINE